MSFEKTKTNAEAWRTENSNSKDLNEINIPNVIKELNQTTSNSINNLPEGEQTKSEERKSQSNILFYNVGILNQRRATKAFSQKINIKFSYDKSSPENLVQLKLFPNNRVSTTK